MKKTVSEVKLPYDKLLEIIDRLGPIESVVNNPIILRMIVGHSADRHLLCALFDRVNLAYSSGRITANDLSYFRSGNLMDDVINLPKTIKAYGDDPNRPIYPGEILDKVNYVSLLEDEASLAACYTHPSIISALADEDVPHKRDLTFWANGGVYTNLPSKVQILIAYAVLNLGNVERAKDLLKKSSLGLDFYPHENYNTNKVM